jgi:hypothetical protein
MANPDTLPDSSDPSGPCPRCGRTSNFNVGAIGATRTGQFPHIGGVVPVERVIVATCMGCGEGTTVVEVTEDGQTFHGLHWWPPPGAFDLDPAVPETIRSAYDEGMRCLGAQCPRAAAVMFRRVLEALVKDTGSVAAQTAAEKNLAQGLKVMADEHTLQPTLAEWATEIRVVGNAGAHLDPIKNVALDEARELARLTRQLLEYLYELPARVARNRQARQADATP